MLGAASHSETEGNKEGYKHFVLHVDCITYFKTHLLNSIQEYYGTVMLQPHWQEHRNRATSLNLVQTDLGCLTVNVTGPQILPKNYMQVHNKWGTSDRKQAFQRTEVFKVDQCLQLQTTKHVASLSFDNLQFQQTCDFHVCS